MVRLNESGYFSFEVQRSITFADVEQLIEAAGDTRTIKFTFQVCHVCRGRGQYVNPNIDRHGLSREDMMEWDAEEIQDYVNGEYNVQCRYCGGKSVEPIPDDAEVLKQQQEEIDSMRVWQNEIELEARMLGEYN